MARHESDVNKQQQQHKENKTNHGNSKQNNFQQMLSNELSMNAMCSWNVNAKWEPIFRELYI